MHKTTLPSYSPVDRIAMIRHFLSSLQCVDVDVILTLAVVVNSHWELNILVASGTRLGLYTVASVLATLLGFKLAGSLNESGLQ